MPLPLPSDLGCPSVRIYSILNRAGAKWKGGKTGQEGRHHFHYSKTSKFSILPSQV